MPNTPYMPSDYSTDYSSNTPAEQATEQLMDEANRLNRMNNLISGGRLITSRRRSRKQRRRSMRGGGRTFDVPLPSTPFQMPGPTPNNAWYSGAPCMGVHCGVPITPTVTEYIHNALDSSTPGANVQYPLIDRLGNSPGENFPGIQPYQGTELNSGPFAFNCVSGGGSRRRRRRIQKKNKKSLRRQNWF